MIAKIALSALALTAALAIGAPAFADDNDMNKGGDQSKPHHMMHHHAMHHTMAHHAMRGHHHDISQDERERAETKRLNEEQARKGNM